MKELHNTNKSIEHAKSVKLWLIAGLVLIFVQVFIGGTTRLTGSGLSITKWEIVTGTLPPLNEAAWNVEFDHYRETPQYRKINEGMALSEFKFIYFWEYFHRLWGRIMGIVFFIPLVYFLSKKMLSPRLKKRLLVVGILAAVVASFGWIMVASGLIDRPWVNAYKLTMHLSLAFLCFGYLLWTTLEVWQPQKLAFGESLHGTLKKVTVLLGALVVLQIMLGGVVSGSHAALAYPTWPDMNGKLIPEVLTQSENWSTDHLINYDSNTFAPAFYQFFHRSLAYLIAIGLTAFLIFAYQRVVHGRYRKGLIFAAIILVLQLSLGILTLLNSKAIIPVGLGVAHQSGGLLLLSAMIYLLFQLFQKEEFWLKTSER